MVVTIKLSRDRAIDLARMLDRLAVYSYSDAGLLTPPAIKPSEAYVVADLRCQIELQLRESNGTQQHRNSSSRTGNSSTNPG